VEKRGSAAAAASDLFAEFFAEQRRNWRRVLNAPRLGAFALGTQVGTTPHDVVFETGSLRLLRYRRETPARYAEPLLLCYALINRPYILDLQPDKSIVARYLAQGFDVYLIDWGVPSAADRRLTIEDYVCRLLDAVVTYILRVHGRERLHLLGYCMGGTLATLSTAIEPSRVSSLTLLAAPIAFDGKESLLNVWAGRQHFDVDSFIDQHGNCPAWFLQGCFLAIKPVQNVLEKGIALYELLGESHALASYFAMERWINDNIPVAGETFREFVKKLYQANELVEGRFHLGTRRVDLARITCPVLLLTARNDHLVPPASTEGIRRGLGATDVASVTIDAGHVGLVVGGKAQGTLWPAATRWLAERSTSATAATASTLASLDTLATPALHGRPAQHSAI
jgi:polyhydroxyalkanoate synthase